jgi:hypothetical protein
LRDGGSDCIGTSGVLQSMDFADTHELV